MIQRTATLPADSPLRPVLAVVVEVLGGPVWLVGGSVRDLLLERPLRDLDLTLPGDKPARVYWIDKGHKAVRLVFRTGAPGEFWGVEQTDWDDAPVLADRSFTRYLEGRRYDLYYSGPHLHMVVLHTKDASYWVVNTLLDALSNETMLAIAKGLKPLARGK